MAGNYHKNFPKKIAFSTEQNYTKNLLGNSTYNQEMQFTKKIILFLTIYLFTITAHTAPPIKYKTNFLTTYQTELNEIENYLQNIKYLSANFLQKSPDGNVVEGKFYLARPGKMRIEYNGTS